MFKWTVTGLIKKTENVLKQNNTMNIEDIYFEDFDEVEFKHWRLKHLQSSETAAIKSVH